MWQLINNFSLSSWNQEKWVCVWCWKAAGDDARLFHSLIYRYITGINLGQHLHWIICIACSDH